MIRSFTNRWPVGFCNGRKHAVTVRLYATSDGRRQLLALFHVAPGFDQWHVADGPILRRVRGKLVPVEHVDAVVL